MDEKEHKKLLKKYEDKSMKEHPEWDAQAEEEMSDKGHSEHVNAVKKAVEWANKQKKDDSK